MDNALPQQENPACYPDFASLRKALDDAFDYFSADSYTSLNLSAGQKAEYISQVLKSFCPEKCSEIDLYALRDPEKPYTRNVIVYGGKDSDDSGAKYTLELVSWSIESSTKIHNYPCEFSLTMPLQGGLKVEKWTSSDGLLCDQQPSHVAFLLEGQVACVSSAHVYRVSNPRKTVPALSLCLSYPPYREHTTWVDPRTTIHPAPASSSTPSSSSPAATKLIPRRTRIGCYSIRGIRTPRLECRLSPHGLMLRELRDKITPAPVTFDSRRLKTAHSMLGSAAAAIVSATRVNLAPGSAALAQGQASMGKKKQAEKKDIVIRTPSANLQLGETIGRGAFGSVFQALNRSSGEIVAVKKLPAPNPGTFTDHGMIRL